MSEKKLQLFKRICLSLIFCLFVFMLLSIVLPEPTVTAQQAECQIKMAAETAEYIKAKKIQLKTPRFEFYANTDEQVYVLSSNESLRVPVKQTVKNTVAVINSKDKNGKSVFYTLEQEMKTDVVTYSVKRDSVVLQSIDVKISNSAENTFKEMKPQPQPKPSQSPSPDPLCIKYLNDWNNMASYALARANETCQRQSWCGLLCTRMDDPIHVPFSLAYVDPTSWRCARYSAILGPFIKSVWTLTPFVNHALDAVVSSQISSFKATGME